MDTATPSATSGLNFDDLVAKTLETIGTKGRRVYQQTFESWRAWCIGRRVSPLDLRASSISQYLIAQKVSYNTRRRHLSALRKLARTLVQVDPDDTERRRDYERLVELRVPQQELTLSNRKQHELTPKQAEGVLTVWSGEKPLHIRNRALVAVLLMTGLRRSEVCALHCADINVADGTLFVAHEEKPELSHTVAIPGEAALQALQAWLAVLGRERRCVFPSIHRSGALGPDTPMTDQAVYKIVKQTQALTGLVFSPQDARRTFLVEALDNGSPLLDVQAQAGHRDITSTLRYAKTAEAKQRRKRLKLRYGSQRSE